MVFDTIPEVYSLYGEGDHPPHDGKSGPLEFYQNVESVPWSLCAVSYLVDCSP